MTTSPYASDAPPEGTVDAVVIGGGAAGLNGALMLARSRRSVVVIDSGSPRNGPAKAMHGFIVLDGTPPPEILRRGREQVRQYGGRVVLGEVVSAEPAAPSVRGGPRFTASVADGQLVARRVLAVATQMQARTQGLAGLNLPMRDLPNTMGRAFASAMAGTTEVPGVWVAGNATDVAAQVGAAAAAGALAGAHINSVLAAADTDAALRAAQGDTRAA